MRSKSVHLTTCTPIASKAVRPRAKSVQKTWVKGTGKGTGKAKSTKKKLGKAVVVISSDSEDLEVDFPHHPQINPKTYQLNNLKNPIHQ